MDNQIIKYFERDRFAAHNGMVLDQVEPGHAVAKMVVTEEHLNAVNMIQGGAIFTLADFAFAAAANACGQVTVGINAGISYFKVAQGNLLMAEAKEISASKRITCYQVNVFDAGNNLIAQVNLTGYRKAQKLEFDK